MTTRGLGRDAGVGHAVGGSAYFDAVLTWVNAAGDGRVQDSLDIRA